MTSFADILENINEAFFVYGMGVESVIYKKPAKTILTGLGIESAAAGGNLSGDPTAAASDGIIGFSVEAAVNRTIEAIVERLSPAPDEMGLCFGPSMRITVRNDSDAGISTAEVDLGKHTVSLPVRFGKSAQDRRLVGIAKQDNAMVTYKVA